METGKRRARDWILGLAPQELAGQREGVVFMIICLVALGFVTAADLVAPGHATVGSIALLPVGASAWLLSRRPAVVVVVVAMALDAMTAVVGAVQPLTAVTQFLMLPVLSFLARVAATGTLRARERDLDARDARAGEERARELERAKSEFLRLASHELRGPVAILRGYLTMIEEGSLGDVSTAVQRVIPILSATATNMNHVVDQMLDTARLEDSRLQLKPRLVDLATIVGEAAESVRLLHGESHPVTVRGCERPLVVRCDASRVSTVVGNLVSNALKYSPAGSEVTVQLSRDPGMAKVSVSDRGLGIPEDQMPRLFTRFGRIERPETAGVQGTGLGLYISRELARLHDGDLTVESTPGEGSTFTLALPIEAAAAAKAPAPAASAQPVPARPQIAG